MNAYTAALSVALSNCCVLTSSCNNIHSKNGSPAWKEAQKNASLHWCSVTVFCSIFNQDVMISFSPTFTLWKVILLYSYFAFQRLFFKWLYVWENALIHGSKSFRMKSYWRWFQTVKTVFWFIDVYMICFQWWICILYWILRYKRS